MLELVRAQKEAKPMAAGAEEVILSCQDILNSEKNSAKSVKEKELRKYCLLYTSDAADER